jgi:hypothetical protein
MNAQIHLKKRKLSNLKKKII